MPKKTKGWRVVKTSQKQNPWRLVDGRGKEVLVRRSIDHPVLGHRAVLRPIHARTKTECTHECLQLLGELINDKR